MTSCGYDKKKNCTSSATRALGITLYRGKVSEIIYVKSSNVYSFLKYNKKMYMK